MTSTSAAWDAFYAFRKNAFSARFTWAGWTAAFSAATLLLFGVSWLPGIDGDVQLLRLISATIFVLGLPGCILSIWANRTALQAAAVGDAKMVARARSRQLALHFLVVFGAALGIITYWLGRGSSGSDVPPWVAGILVTNLLGLGGLAFVKDQYEDSVVVSRQWMKLTGQEKRRAKLAAQEMLFEHHVGLGMRPARPCRCQCHPGVKN